MRVTPYFFEWTHGSFSRSEAGCNVIIVAYVVGNKRTKISEGLGEANKAVCNGKGLGFVEVVIHGMFVVSLPWVMFVVVTNCVDASFSVGVMCSK